MKSNIPNFAMYMISGVLAWNFFSSTLISAVNAFTGNSSLINKVSFPRYYLIFSSVGFNFVVFMMTMIIAVVGIFIFNIKISWSIFYLPVAILLELLLLTGFSLIVSSLNVAYHDTGHLVEVLVMIWFWLTPIVYAWNVIPENFRFAMAFNPMAIIIALYQNALVNQPVEILWYPGVIVNVLLLMMGIKLYRRFSPYMAEWI